jgi:glutamyl-tRNA reductase
MYPKRLMIVGLNHTTAPVEVREQLVLDRPALKESVARLISLGSVEEGVIIATCNRVELVATASDGDRALSDLKSFFHTQERLDPGADLERHLYRYVDGDAVRHVFRVAASLDSMVVGEPQILGQLKDSYLVAREVGAVGSILHRLFHRSFSVAKKVRSETGIGSGAVSVSSIAVDLAKRIFDQLENKTILLIGAGKMGELIVRHLQRNGVRSLMVTNRTFERAVELAAQYHGSPILFEDYPRYLRLADLIVGCTASPQVLLKPELVTEVLKERKQKAMFFVDLGIPRNFDPGINEIDNAYVYNIDDLKTVADENLQERGEEAQKAEVLIEDEVAAFLRWLDSLEQVPVIVALRQKFEEIRLREIEKSLSTSLKGMAGKERQALEDMTQAIINKILHEPVTRLKQQRVGQDEALYTETLKKLFGIDEK